MMKPIRGLHLLGAILMVASLRAGAAAALIRPAALGPGAGSGPMLSASGGTVAYQYDPASGTGLLTLNNNPYTLATGTTGDPHASINPDFSNTLHQILAVQLDSNGNLVTSPANQFEIRGKVDLGGQTYDGVLLHGRPVALGSQSLAPLGVSDTAFFDTKVAIDGGLLASNFSSDLYLRFLPTLGNTFNGHFDASFSGSNVVSQSVPFALTVPEPTPVVLAGAALLWMLARRRPGRS